MEKKRMENKMQDSNSLREKIENTINVIQFEKGGDLTVAESITTGGMDRIMQIVASEISKAREEGRRELLDSIIEGVTQLKDLVSMFNPMSPEIRAKQSGEIEAYNGLLEKLSKLTTK